MKKMSEKFCLRWNDFESNISSALKDLKDDEDFLNVTLIAGEDQVKAHKLILSACSPFFRTILKRNKHHHPLLYLRGVTYPDLLALLDFMYYGEVNIAQDSLNSFLSVAEELKIKGLTQEPGRKTEPEPQTRDKRPVRAESQLSDDIQDVTPLPVKAEPLTAAVVAEEELAEYEYGEGEVGDDYHDVTGSDSLMVAPASDGNKGEQ